MSNTLSVRDLYLATYLLVQEVPLLQTTFEGSFVTFVFSDKDGKAKEASERFNDSNPMVPLRQALQNWNYVKYQVAQARGGARP